MLKKSKKYIYIMLILIIILIIILFIIFPLSTCFSLTFFASNTMEVVYPPYLSMADIISQKQTTHVNFIRSQKPSYLSMADLIYHSLLEPVKVDVTHVKQQLLSSSSRGAVPYINSPTLVRVNPPHESIAKLMSYWQSTGVRVDITYMQNQFRSSANDSVTYLPGYKLVYTPPPPSTFLAECIYIAQSVQVPVDIIHIQQQLTSSSRGAVPFFAGNLVETVTPPFFSIADFISYWQHHNARVNFTYMEKAEVASDAALFYVCIGYTDLHSFAMALNTYRGIPIPQNLQTIFVQNVPLTSGFTIMPYLLGTFVGLIFSYMFIF